MKYLKQILVSIVFICFLGAAQTKKAHALEAEDLLAIFAQYLDPYGQWQTMAPYGRVWSPYQQANWQPYSQGHWIYTEEYGWVWDPEEPWGDVVHHYGRWFNQSDRWYWVPDDTWGPAWVDWRSSGDYIGWAPLPPVARWTVRDEWRPSYNWRHYHPSHAYTFVPRTRFFDRDVRRHRAARERIPVLIQQSQPLTVYRTVNQRIVNVGPRRDVIERETGRRIQRERYEPRRVVHKDERDARAKVDNRRDDRDQMRASARFDRIPQAEHEKARSSPPKQVQKEVRREEKPKVRAAPERVIRQPAAKAKRPEPVKAKPQVKVERKQPRPSQKVNPPPAKRIEKQSQHVRDDRPEQKVDNRPGQTGQNRGAAKAGKAKGKDDKK